MTFYFKTKTQKAKKDKKNNFFKEIVKNADLLKPILNKIITTK